MTRFAPAALALGLTACGHVFSPPVRGLHPGMPGRLTRGDIEAGVDVGGPSVPVLAVTRLGFALFDHAQVEVGANFAPGDAVHWAMGWLGTRLSRTLSEEDGWHAVGDIGLALGAGLGGTFGNDPTWTQRQAWGVSQDLGLGLQWKAFGVFARGRIEASIGQTTPAALYPSVLLGLEVRPFRWLALGASAGYGGHWNRPTGYTSYALWQGSASFVFATR